MTRRIANADCLKWMSDITDGSVDMVLCDLPYGVLNKGNKHATWDCQIPMEPLWENWLRVCRPNAAIVLFAQGMFTAQLMMSMPRLWRYNLIWDKHRVTGFLNANRMPLRCHEDILVFYRKLPTYHPQMEELNGRERNHPQGYGPHREYNRCYGKIKRITPQVFDKKHPRSIIKIPREHDNNQLHPTQKPVALLSYLIRTYTNEGDTVLDNCMGSGSTGVACVETNRNFIGIEKDAHYFTMAKKRIDKALAEPQQQFLFPQTERTSA